MVVAVHLVEIPLELVPALWINLQKFYELRFAEQEKGQEIRRTIRRRNQETSLVAPADV